VPQRHQSTATMRASPEQAAELIESYTSRDQKKEYRELFNQRPIQ
jgi:hypothetical protein